MEDFSVTSKGQVTIPRDVRQKLNIRAGSRVRFKVVGTHAELQVVGPAAPAPEESGFGLLRSRRKPVPVDFDVASLAGRE
jgi:AbrB family looped-hinge helix DNA binding protein